MSSAGRVLITGAAVREIADLASRDLRRRVVETVAGLAADPPARDRLAGAGLCRRREAGFEILYRLRGPDLVICAVSPEAGSSPAG